MTGAAPERARSMVRPVVLERTHASERIAPGSRRRSLSLAGLIVLTVAILAVSSIDQAVLCALPALILPLLLALRRYPGERALMSLASPCALRRPRAASRPRPPVSVWIGVPRGGLLIARSLADRPPPHLRLAAA